MNVQIIKSGKHVSLAVLDDCSVVESLRCDQYMSVEDALELVSAYYGIDIDIRNGVSYRDGAWYEAK